MLIPFVRQEPVMWARYCHCGKEGVSVVHIQHANVATDWEILSMWYELETEDCYEGNPYWAEDCLRTTNLKLLITINQWLNVVCTHDATPHPCSGQKLFRLTPPPHLLTISSPCAIWQASPTMPCILNTVRINSPYVVVCMHVQQTCSADTAKPAMLSNTMHAYHTKAHWWLPHNQYWTIPSFPGHLLLFFLIIYMIFHSIFLTEYLTFSKVTCGQQNRVWDDLGMRVVEQSLLIMSFADEASPACGKFSRVKICVFG